MIGIVICFLLILSAFIVSVVTKDVTNPLFLLLASWIFSVTVLVVGDYDSSVRYMNYYSFIPLISTWMFGVGGILAGRGKMIVDPKMVKKTRDNIEITALLKAFIIFEIAFFAVFSIVVIKSAFSNFSYNLWYSINTGIMKSVSWLKMLCVYVSPIMIVLMNILFVHYLSCGKDKKYLFVQVFITVLLVALTNGRAGLLRLIIPMIYIYMVMRKKSNMQIIKMGGKSLLIVLMIFFLYNSLKRVEVENNQVQYAVNSFLGYASGGITAFSQWCETPHELFYGSYTFRPIFTILRALGYPVQVVSVFEPFLRGPGGTLGNVYTSLKWYANDFGIVYALIVQLALGVLHFVLYLKMHIKRTTGYLIACATSIYPLLMQFFSDQYVTSTVLWIIYVIAGIMFLKTPFFIKRKNFVSND